MVNVVQRGVQDAHWDGVRMLFQMTINDAVVRCSISKPALRDIIFLHSRDCFDPMSCFVHNRPWIEAIAWAKYVGQIHPSQDRLHIWPSDVFALPAATAIGLGMQPEQFAHQPPLSQANGTNPHPAGH